MVQVNKIMVIFRSATHSALDKAYFLNALKSYTILMGIYRILTVGLKCPQTAFFFDLVVEFNLSVF